ncbi:hypothetical protein T06_12495 [Trichinella sp. T6]|nr:hypothetical protein T06_12495 [Trichinella sp. T6]
MDYSDGISKFIFDPGVHRPQRVDMEHFWRKNYIFAIQLRFN